MDNSEIRKSIRRSMFGEAAFGGYYNQNRNVQDNQLQPHEVKVTDDTVGVMEFRYNSKDMQDVSSVLDNLKPYFDDIEVQFVGLSNDADLIGINVKHKYKNLLSALMQHYGFIKDVETWGDEMRSAKRVFSARGGSYSGGTHGNFPMPFLLGEIPTTGGIYEDSQKEKNND